MHFLAISLFNLFLISLQVCLIESDRPKLPFSDADTVKYLEQAGCGKSGELLDIGVCTRYGYRPQITPKVSNSTPAKIYTTVNYQAIRDVDDKKGNLRYCFSTKLFSKTLLLPNFSRLSIFNYDVKCPCRRNNN